MTHSAPERLEFPSSTVSNWSDCELFWRFITNTALKQDKIDLGTELNISNIVDR